MRETTHAPPIPPNAAEESTLEDMRSYDTHAAKGGALVKDLIWPFANAEDIGYILWPVAAGGVISLGALLIVLSFVWP